MSSCVVKFLQLIKTTEQVPKNFPKRIDEGEESEREYLQYHTMGVDVVRNPCGQALTTTDLVQVGHPAGVLGFLKENVCVSVCVCVTTHPCLSCRGDQ